MAKRYRGSLYNLRLTFFLTLLCTLSMLPLGGVFAQSADSLLPDIIVRENDLYDYDIVTDIIPGHTHLRLSNGTPNIGLGPLHLWGDDVRPSDVTRDVYQRIFLTDSTYVDHLAGKFVYHPTHGHIHFEGWAMYRLREVLPDDGVGAIIAEGEKTSFCILDLGIYDSNLPNFDPDGEYHQCETSVQGLSVGWVDVYSKDLPDQNIDITGIPDGIYWLESEVDPENNVIESDETNNVTRVKVAIGQPEEITPDAYEPNESTAGIDNRPPGGPNSPNLGPCNPQKTVSGLSIDPGSNVDYFKFYCNETGSDSDFVRIQFVHALGDIDMQLFDQSLVQVDQSNGTTNTEEISLAGKPEGWYYLKVFGYNGAVNPDYTLTVDPPQNNPPTVTALTPPVGDVEIVHSVETYTTQWNFNDPEGDQCWVSVYVNTNPVLDGNELLLPTSLNTDAILGSYVINSAYLGLASYWIYTEITDGGSTSGDWSEGTLTTIEPCCTGSVGNVNCSADRLVTISDISTLVDYLFITATPLCCPEAANASGDPEGQISVTDIGTIVDFLFITGAPLADCP